MLLIARNRRPLTEEEEWMLQTWQEQQPEQEEEAKKIQQLIEKAALAELRHRIDKREAWERINRQTQATALWKKRSIKHLWRTVAAVMLPILLAGGGLWWLSPNTTYEQLLAEQANIRPGSARAELLLAGGERIVLRNEQQQKIVDRKGKTVGIDSANRLVYIASTKKSVEWNSLHIPQGGEYQLLLPDGTKVWLNSASKLKFPNRFEGNERRVELEGEAFFEVARDTLHPFQIKTAHSAIRVLGTSFNVSCYPDENIERTTLVEGKVEVTAGGQTAALQPGKQFRLDIQTQTVEIEDVDVELYVSWKDGLFRFCELPLEELTLKLERWYDVHFFFQQSECRQARFTGAIRKYANLQEFIRLIEATTDVKFEIKGNTITIRKK